MVPGHQCKIWRVTNVLQYLLYFENVLILRKHGSSMFIPKWDNGELF